MTSGLTERTDRQPASADAIEDAADVSAFRDIRRGLRAGLYGGVPLSGPVANALTLLLKALEWRPSAAQLAKAMPHYPEGFDAAELRAVVSRLGYPSRRHRGAAWRVQDHQLPALAVSRSGEASVLVARSATGFIAVRSDGEAVERSFVGRTDAIYLFGRQRPTGAAQAEDPALAGPPKVTQEMARRFGGPVRMLLAMSLAINLLTLVNSLSVMAIYDAVIPTGALGTLSWLVAGLAASVAIEFALRVLKSRLIGHVGETFEFITGSVVFERLLGMPLEMTSGAAVSAQAAQVRQFEGLRDALLGPMAQVYLELPLLSVFLIAMAVIAGPLALAPILLIVLYGAAAAFIIPELRRRSEALARVSSERDALTVEIVSQVRAIRALGGAALWRARADALTLSAAQARRDQTMLTALAACVAAAGLSLASIGLMIAGSLRVIEGAMTPGALIATFIIAWRVFAPLQQGFMATLRFGDALSTLRRLESFNQLKQERRPVHGLPLGVGGEGEIRFTEVGFRYPRGQRPALAGISFTARAGEHVAIMGASGSGKSTLLKAALGLHLVQSGTVAIDGVDVRLLDLEALRGEIGAVMSTPTLFHGTIAQNLRLAAVDASDDALLDLCARLGVADQIAALPDGLETRITDFSKLQIPNGLRQMITIAQALARQPKILLLDEAANGLDGAQEAALLAALDALRGRTTTLMATHRPSHALRADRLIVLERGRLVASGEPRATLEKMKEAQRHVA